MAAAAAGAPGACSSRAAKKGAWLVANLAGRDIASGDEAVARETVTGTHKGNFMGIAVTNKPVST